MRRPIHATTSLEGDVAAMRHRLARDPTRWLPEPAEQVGQDEYRVRLATGDLLPVPGVIALLNVGEALTPAPRLALRSISWHAAAVDSLFPVLTADLELLEHDANRGQLRLVGSYRPPLSVVGAAADQLVGRHLAVEVVRSFVAKIAGRLAAGASTRDNAVTGN